MNLRDGRVEAVFEGLTEPVKKAVSWCRQGPPSARVDSVKTEWEEPSGQYAYFRIKR